MQFGCDPRSSAEVVKVVRKATTLPLITKLTPNVGDIASIAKAVEDAGSDAVSLINTVLGMSIDAEKRCFNLSTGTGGLSGPAIRPIAVRMVWECAQKIRIPVIGLGGILTAKDALEFFLAGAKAVQIGTANFIDSEAPLKVIEGIKGYLSANKIEKLSDLKPCRT
jgi:dihydroorotate dehydrogenase (NAD+) catalytic subunit